MYSFEKQRKHDHFCPNNIDISASNNTNTSRINSSCQREYFDRNV